MQTLTNNSAASTKVQGDTSTEMRRRAVVLQARLILPERNMRPPKEVVAGPVRNAGSSLMLHLHDNEYYPLSYGVPVRERFGSTLLPATREQHDQNCTQSH